jgi:hypothetical protein
MGGEGEKKLISIPSGLVLRRHDTKFYNATPLSGGRQQVTRGREVLGAGKCISPRETSLFFISQTVPLVAGQSSCIFTI